ncbi:MAG: rhodanese-like domain-containing protein, partial [Ignavibacteriales bacterium]
TNLNNYLIIDVRSRQDYLNGHIETAKNIPNNELLNYLLSNNAGSYSKIVIVSSNGQASAYYTSLLRLYGLNNVYTLNFGMAYWNIDFAQEWLQKINTSSGISIYNNNNYTKGSFTDLPIVFEPGGDITSLAKHRISFLIERGFVNKVDDIDETIIGSVMYFICYGSFDLYYSPSRNGPGHPPDAILYRERIDLRSTNFLQTLPTAKDILIYDYSGQYSAAVTAYLRVLGYNANSFLFGACQLFYSRMIEYMSPYAFIPERINNFPYITEN